MRHDDFRDLLAAQHDLSPEHKRQLLEHVETCADCQALRLEYARQDVFLRTLPLPDPQVGLRNAVLNEIGGSKPRKLHPLPRILAMVLPLAAMAAAAVLVVHDRHGTRSSALPNGSADGIRHGPGPLLSRSLGATTIPASPLIPPPAQARQPRYQVVRVVDGLRISMLTARNAYPVDALVPVRVTVRNLGLDPVTLENDQPYGCTDFRPRVVAIDARGRIAEPLPVAGRPIPSCPLIPPMPGRDILRKGQTQHFILYTILATRHLQARMVVHRYHGCLPASTNCRPQNSLVQDDQATYRLLRSDPPRPVVHGAPPSSVDLLGAPRKRGSLWADGWYSCRATRGQRWTGQEGGVNVPGADRGGKRLNLHLTGCDPHQTTLHAIVGWPNHSVAHINYPAPQRSGVPAK